MLLHIANHLCPPQSVKGFANVPVVSKNAKVVVWTKPANSIPYLALQLHYQQVTSC